MTAPTNLAADRLKTFIERIERLTEDKEAVVTDIKEVLSEAKGEGYDAKIIRKIIARRKRDKAEIQEEEALMELYLSAIGEQ